MEAEGIAIINGWKFVAKLTHEESGNVIFNVSGDEVPARYYNAPPVCEHCNSKRRRTSTYIVMNTETNEFRQVGKSCLADYTHGMSAEMAADYVSMFEEIIQGEAPYGDSFQRYYNMEKYLHYVAETILHFGYVSRSQECASSPSTADRAFKYYLAGEGYSMMQGMRDGILREMKSVGFDAESEEATKKTSDALAWIATQEDSNNYMHNLITIAKMEYITSKHMGYIASIFVSYDRDMGYQKKKAAWKAEKERRAAITTNSAWVGNVGERRMFSVKSIDCVTSFDTVFGIKRIYRIIDTEGNVFIWKTDNRVEGNYAKMTGSIKAHNEFRGVKQTELTRCKFA